MHVLPLPVRVLLNSIEFLITVFICNIYLRECSNYSLIIMVIGNKAYSNGAIAQFPIFIAIFLLITDIIMIGRHLFCETHEYGVIVDYFGKGDDSVWTLLNYDFCIICLQILKYFTVYNYLVLDIYYHKPSIVKDVIKEYAQPNYDLQYISVTNNNEDQDNNKEDRSHQQRKYVSKRNLFDRIFRRGKDVGEFDNDENVVLIIKDNEEIEEDEEEQINTQNNNSENNPILPINQDLSSSSHTLNQINPQNEPFSNSKQNQPSTSSLSATSFSNSNNNAIPSSSSKNEIDSFIAPKNDIIKNTDNPINSKLSTKDKGKSHSQSSDLTSSSKGKEPEDQDDIFFDAYDQSENSSHDDYDYSPSPSSHSSAIPLHHVNSSTSHQAHQIRSENTEDTEQNEMPIYEIDERERVTEGNENALLYLESYYQFIPVINIKINEAIKVMMAIRHSNRRFFEHAKKEAQEQRRREQEQHLREQEQEQLSSSLFSLQFQNQDLVQEPESEIPEQGTENQQPSSQNRNQSSSSNGSSIVSNQLRSYFNGLHSSFRRSLTGVPSV
ncbi:hypothetical protein BCR36DRAFT_411049 [Piromyces finnis]|uniref:DUF1746 domain-containing protein n=1 Tax=Piromyces finnis TaxID=1754191 RepID=A0A1Y1VEB4_9FUNG|nr:hypothetical protein BCR36DRAFT_411049 [Piromyces finnis]|eukprot:ORX53908.1 hypothetical protein BCR36DRAFT_411049 [Piromyces finnis]